MDTESVQLRDGRSVVLRHAELGDGALFRAYLTELGASTEFMLTHPGDMAMADTYERSLSRIGSRGFYSLHALDPEVGVLVGNASFYFTDRVKLSHTAGLAMGVLPDWQGAGLGMLLLERAMDDIRTYAQISRLQLVVMEGNEHAKRMYERVGFLDEGRSIRAVRQPDGSFRDEYRMGMWIGG